MTVVLDLPTDLADLLRAEAEKRGQPVSDFVRPALVDLLMREQGHNESPLRVDVDTDTGNSIASGISTDPAEQPHRVPSIGEVLDKIWGDIPAEELAKIPSDLSANLDHYIYGTKKRQ